jgi:chromosome segregation ATPase
MERTMTTRHRLNRNAVWLAQFATVGATLIGLAVPLSAAAQSLEDRLRSQLRTTTQQLHEAQDAQAQLQTQLSAAQQARDQALADLKSSQAARARTAETDAAQRALAAERASHAQDSARLARSRADYEALVAQARANETTARDAAARDKTRDAALQQCEAKNLRLYALGHEVINAYEHVSLSSFLASRQPFAQASRISYDRIAEEYGDVLQAARFDPNARPVAASATAAP